MDYKSFAGGVKIQTEPGAFVARFARLNAIDADSDVTLPGAFESGAAVKICAWGHDWKQLPVGTGVIYERGDSAEVEGRFFLDTPNGAAHYETVKKLGPLAEFSYGFDTLQSEPGLFEGRKVRFLKKLKVHEISPVMRGAGDTALLSIKGLHRAALTVYGALQELAALDYEAHGPGHLLSPSGVLRDLEEKELEELDRRVKQAYARPVAPSRGDLMLRDLLAADTDDPGAQPRGRYAAAQLEMWVDSEAEKLLRERPWLRISVDEARAIVRRWLSRAAT